MEGRLVLDRFRLAEELGRGAFGTVYRARDMRLQRDVAVKVLANGPGSRRVLREAQAAARLNHPSIVTLYELGEDATAIYLVSELVDGQTLRELIRHGRISDRDLAEAGSDVCDALAHAHERGVVHRDVKPENIAVARWEDARIGPWSSPSPSGAMLMDFGVASVAGSSSLTRTGEVVGTLAYMAPEQAEGEAAGPAADVYSLALVLYEAFSGHNPVTRATPAATARAIGAPIPGLAERRPDLPTDLAATIDACLEPYTEHRHPPKSCETSSTTPPAPSTTRVRSRCRETTRAAAGDSACGGRWFASRPSPRSPPWSRGSRPRAEAPASPPSSAPSASRSRSSSTASGIGSPPPRRHSSAWSAWRPCSRPSPASPAARAAAPLSGSSAGAGWPWARR